MHHYTIKHYSLKVFFSAFFFARNDAFAHIWMISEREMDAENIALARNKLHYKT